MQLQEPTGDLADLMKGFVAGDREAARRLVELFEPELRRIAGARMGAERPDHTLQPTALVNELYLELLRIGPLATPSGAAVEKADFLRLCTFLMRRLLIHHARPLSRRVRRASDAPERTVDPRPSADLLADIDRALTQLNEINPAIRQVVEMKVFEGRSQEEIAARLGCAVRTVTRYWRFAQHWLSEELAPLLR